MPSVIFSGSKVKALKDRLSLNDVTEIISVSSNPASGGGVVAPIGSLALDSVAGKVYRKVGSANTNWSEVGAGTGGINYITNPDAENGTTGWNLYADAAGAAPVDGTGGSANITWTRSTTTPLRGTADFNLVKDAVNRQGQGVSFDITIDAADQAKVLTVEFDYEVLSGTYATGDLAVYLIQDPSGTPVVIQPAGFRIQAGTVGTKLKQIATFQTASNVTSYRLCVHVASTSTSAYSLAIDNVSVGPQVVQYGAPVTDWQEYTPTTQGFGTISAAKFYWRRVGDSLELNARFVTGTVTATEARVSLPSGLTTADSTKINGLTPFGFYGQNATTTVHGGLILVANSVTYVNFSDRGTFGASNLNSLAATVGTGVSGSGETVAFSAKVPILGWSSTVQMSNDTDTRVVAARAYVSTNAAITTVQPINFDTIENDTHGAVTTGASWKFTAPVSGFYQVEASAVFNAGNTLRVYVNGSFKCFLDGSTTAGQAVGGSTIVYLNSGQYIDIRPENTGLLQSAPNSTHISVFRLSGPSAIAASETVAASYWLSANQAVTVGVTNVNFDTREFDTHGAVTTGSSWAFNAPISGTYCFALTVETNGSTSFAAYKNGTIYKYIAVNPSANVTGGGSVLIRLNAGDSINIRTNATITVRGQATMPSLPSQIHIHRIGN